jgi:hypothetical protein
MNSIMGVVRSIVVCGCVLIVGCAPTVQPRISQAEFLVPQSNEIRGKVEVYVSQSFKTHSKGKKDISELKKWKFELGSVAVDAFQYGVESCFDDVSVVLAEPEFPKDVYSDYYAAVRPSFTHFETSDPILFKFENYKATVGFSVSVYNARGVEIQSKTYTGEGMERGSIGYADPGHAA